MYFQPLLIIYLHFMLTYLQPLTFHAEAQPQQRCKSCETAGESPEGAGLGDLKKTMAHLLVPMFMSLPLQLKDELSDDAVLRQIDYLVEEYGICVDDDREDLRLNYDGFTQVKGHLIQSCTCWIIGHGDDNACAAPKRTRCCPCGRLRRAAERFLARLSAATSAPLSLRCLRRTQRAASVPGCSCPT